MRQTSGSRTPLIHRIRGGEAEDVEALGREASERATRFVVLVSAKTPAREGGHIELAVDTSVLHFFDRETGESIYEG